MTSLQKQFSFAGLALAASLVVGCQTYKPPVSGDTATISFAYFEYQSLSGFVSVRHVPGVNKPPISWASMTTVSPIQPENLGEALKTSHPIPANGESFSFNMNYSASVPPITLSCDVLMTIHPVPGKQYIAIARVHQGACLGAVMTKVESGYELDSTATLSVNGKPMALPSKEMFLTAPGATLEAQHFQKKWW